MGQGEQQEHRPPFFSSWNQLYAAVLVFHAVVILLLYLFTVWFDLHA